LAREAEAASDTADSGGHEVVKVAVCGGSELQSAEANIVESFVVKGEAHISILDKLMDGKGGIVGLNYSVRHLGGRDDREGRHDTIGVLLTNLGDEKSAHTRASSTTHGVSHLETLETVARFCLLADNVKDGVNELSSFSVVALGPVVSSTSLAKDEVVRAEKLAERSSTDRVHSSGLEIHEDSTRDVASTGGLIEVNVDAFELEIRISVVGSSRINAVFI